MFSVLRDFDNENSFVDNSPFINNASFKNDETTNENKTDKVMKDIMDVLKINLKSILAPVFTENERMNNYIMNIPIVQKMKQENIQYKAEINSMKKFYDSMVNNLRDEIRELKNGHKMKLNIREK